MSTRTLGMNLAVACWVLASALLPQASAAVSDEQFNDLKDLVGKLGQKIESQDQRIQQLEKTHQQDQKTHELDQAIHEQDRQKIQDLEQKVGETQRTATDAQQKAALAAQAGPMPRVPIDEATVNHNFMILGDAEVQFAQTAHQNAAFLLADFAPIFLYRGGDNVLFEAGFDFVLQNNQRPNPGATTTVNLSFAQLDYLLNDYVTFVGGNMLLPLGTYVERSAGWLNKIPDDPLPRDLLPGSGVGVQLRGAVPFGQSGASVAYSVWGVNGPSSSDGTDNPSALDLGGNVGLRSDNVVANLHGHPSGGGRLGLFVPFKPHYDFEVGISGQSGEWDDAGTHLWTAGVVDASLHLGSFFEVRGEYIRTQYGSDSGLIRPEGWWVQAGYKLAGLNLSVPGINNVEIVNRFDSIHDGLGVNTRRYTAGGIYYFSNTLLLEGDYEFFSSNDPSQQDRFIVQLSYGF